MSAQKGLEKGWIKILSPGTQADSGIFGQTEALTIKGQKM